jgi:hypothetical protein
MLQKQFRSHIRVLLMLLYHQNWNQHQIQHKNSTNVLNVNYLKRDVYAHLNKYIPVGCLQTKMKFMYYCNLFYSAGEYLLPFCAPQDHLHPLKELLLEQMAEKPKELTIEAFQNVLGAMWDNCKGNFKEENFYAVLDEENFKKSFLGRENLRIELKRSGFFEGGSKGKIFASYPSVTIFLH